MKAIIYTQYGPPEVLHLADLPKPTPQADQVLVRVRATSVNFGDLLARNYKAVTPRSFNMLMLFWFFAKLYFGFDKPKHGVLGSEFAGEIEAVGSAVKRFKVGDQVFGYNGQSMGAYAEYLCLPENAVLAPKPANLSFEEAAVTPYGAVMALHLFPKMAILPGQKVLIVGASGSIGSAAVQLARHFGAEVTGVCAAPRLDYVRSLGADHVIDYTKDDFTRNGKTYDLIFDVLGKSSFSRCKASLTPNGRYLLASFKMKQLLQMLWTSRFSSQKVICVLAPGGLPDLLAVKELVEAGVLRPVIDRRFPLEQAAAAHRYLESGLARAKVVITI